MLDDYPYDARRGPVTFRFTAPNYGVIIDHPIQNRKWAWLSDVPEQEFEKIPDRTS